MIYFKIDEDKLKKIIDKFFSEGWYEGDEIALWYLYRNIDTEIMTQFRESCKERFVNGISSAFSHDETNPFFYRVFKPELDEELKRISSSSIILNVIKRYHPFVLFQ